MKNYSTQLGKFIESTLFANSFYRRNDSRTWVSYYKAHDGMVHSNSANYSLIGSNGPVTIEDFNQLVESDKGCNVTFFNL